MFYDWKSKLKQLDVDKDISWTNKVMKFLNIENINISIIA